MPRYIDLNKLASEMMSKDDFFFFLSENELWK